VVIADSRKAVFAVLQLSYDENTFVKKTKYCFPVKIKMTSTHLKMLDDPALIDLLIDQVYQFNLMYWKSVAQHTIPVKLL
jgi:hypothetical protein